ncbi:hypothetical protein OGAPHI_000097 [Ogataea philodendri]|uniref:Uncharacterized protein n=1 Tax=Ogataea philodendri TaxID=1378263 RepID=A0A9P8TAI1_9ASCO|nr:uncharacterized protein OGAPHI_000097 [Ogataea philodendri]KAH3671911.1 hypothetical protein OGAPHI_000097 [Ogataea philodendri]
MISSKNSDSSWIPNFHSHQVADRLHRVVSSVDVISHEQIVCVWARPSDFEQLHQIVELAVNISTYSDWHLHGLDVLLVLDNFDCHSAQLFNRVFTQWFTLAQLFYPTVQRVSLGGGVCNANWNLGQNRSLFCLFRLCLLNSVFHLNVGVQIHRCCWMFISKKSVLYHLKS